MAWVVLIIAGLFEVAMALALKLSAGFSHLWWSLSFGAFALAIFGLLSYALKSLEVGTAYAIWTRIGAVGTAAIRMLLMGDHASPLQLASMAFILPSLIGLNLAGAAH